VAAAVVVLKATLASIQKVGNRQLAEQLLASKEGLAIEELVNVLENC
jgi:hypothetical protein